MSHLQEFCIFKGARLDKLPSRCKLRHVLLNDGRLFEKKSYHVEVSQRKECRQCGKHFMKSLKKRKCKWEEVHVMGKYVFLDVCRNKVVLVKFRDHTDKGHDVVKHEEVKHEEECSQECVSTHEVEKGVDEVCTQDSFTFDEICDTQECEKGCDTEECSEKGCDTEECTDKECDTEECEEKECVEECADVLSSA